MTRENDLRTYFKPQPKVAGRVQMPQTRTKQVVSKGSREAGIEDELTSITLQRQNKSTSIIIPNYLNMMDTKLDLCAIDGYLSLPQRYRNVQSGLNDQVSTNSSSHPPSSILTIADLFPEL